MTEILTKLWINIDNFNYKRIDHITNISQDDLEILNHANRKFLIKPTLCLMVTILFSKNRVKLWNRFREFLYKDRVIPQNFVKETSTAKSSLINNAEINLNNNTKETKFVYVRENSHSEFESRTIKLGKWKRFSKRNQPSDETNEIIMTRQEPTFSEEYLGFISNQKKNIHKLSGFKIFLKKFRNKNFVMNKGENFLMNTKLIYLPFVIILLLSAYELLFTYVGLYFKYQPLIDEYCNQKYLKI
jgi:hypothetical protein